MMMLQIRIKSKPNMERQFVISENHLWLSFLRCCFCVAGDKSAALSKDVKGIIIIIMIIIIIIIAMQYP